MATPEQRAVWGVRQRFRHAAVRRPMLLSCGPPLSWARLLAGGVGVCELPARRRRDEAIEARVSSPPVGTVPRRCRAAFVRTCAAHSRRSGWPGRPVPSARAPRIRCRDKFLLLICISFPAFSSSRPGHEHCLFNSHLPVPSLFPPRKPLCADL